MMQMGQNNEQETRVALTNQMQMMVAEANGEEVANFIDTKAGLFREYINTHPDTIDRFRRGDTTVLDEVGKHLYH